MYRDNTKKIKIGNVEIGGGNRIAIQSMTNTETSDIDATVEQILRLEEAGCDIVRCTANTEAAARAFEKLKERTHVPLVADIHFQYKLAIMAMEAGADKIRINQQFIDKYNGVTAEGIVESALDKVRMIEEQDYDNIVISIKSSDVLMSVKTHELIAERTKYPLHVGITESGTLWSGNIKSSVGLGIILNQGIGDTIRVSLTGDPVEEVKSAKLILKTLGLRNDGITLVSCPTCGRTHIDLIGLANQTEKLISQYSNLNIKVAVMGCAVNGPGEAREADLGIAGGDGVGLVFKKGEILRKVPQEQLLLELKKELDNWDEN